MLGRLPLCSLLLYKIHSFRLFTYGRSSSKSDVLCSDASCDSFLWLLRLGAIRMVDGFLYLLYLRELKRNIAPIEIAGDCEFLF